MTTQKANGFLHVPEDRYDTNRTQTIYFPFQDEMILVTRVTPARYSVYGTIKEITRSPSDMKITVARSIPEDAVGKVAAHLRSRGLRGKLDFL